MFFIGEQHRPRKIAHLINRKHEQHRVCPVIFFACNAALMSG
jgi:hypothetical protein